MYVSNKPNPPNPDPRCLTERASYSQFNDWDGDGISNWDDIDDDGDGIMDIIDIDWDCDFDNDAVFHQINGSLYRDDGPNDVDSDIDGDGLSNDIDWDDDNDGLNVYTTQMTEIVVSQITMEPTHSQLHTIHLETDPTQMVAEIAKITQTTQTTTGHWFGSKPIPRCNSKLQRI